MIPALVILTKYLLLLSGIYILFLILLRKAEADRTLSGILLVGFLARVSYGTIDDFFGVLVGRYDFNKFDSALWFVAQHWRQGEFLAVFQLPERMYALYSVVYAPVYTVFGHETVLVRLVGAFIGVLFVWNVYRITKLLANHRAGLYAAGFSAFFPYWIYLSVLFYRDMLVLLLLSQTIYLLLWWLRRDGFGLELIAAIGFAGLALSLRVENVAPLGAAFGTAVLVKIYRGITLKDVKYLIGTLLTAGVAAVYEGSIIHLVNRVSVEMFAGQRRFLSRTTADGAYLSDLLYSSGFELLAFLPIGAFYFLFVPFPWHTETLLGTVALVQNLVLWYPAAMLSLVGIRVLGSNYLDELLVLLAYVCVGVLLYGAVEGNIGPAMRHRSQFQFCLVVFAGIGFDRLFRFRVGNRWQIMWRASSQRPMEKS